MCLFLPPCHVQELAVKLMELVSVAPVEVQRDIITSLPEILDDSQHNDIARELKWVLSVWIADPVVVAQSDITNCYFHLFCVALYSRRTLS